MLSAAPCKRFLSRLVWSVKGSHCTIQDRLLTAQYVTSSPESSVRVRDQTFRSWKLRTISGNTPFSPSSLHPPSPVAYEGLSSQSTPALSTPPADTDFANFPPRPLTCYWNSEYVNAVHLLGKVRGDPFSIDDDYSYSGASLVLCTSIAEDPSGYEQSIQVVFYGSAAEQVLQYATDGMEIAVMGCLQPAINDQGEPYPIVRGDQFFLVRRGPRPPSLKLPSKVPGASLQQGAPRRSMTSETLRAWMEGRTISQISEATGLPVTKVIDQVSQSFSSGKHLGEAPVTRLCEEVFSLSASAFTYEDIHRAVLASWQERPIATKTGLPKKTVIRDWLAKEPGYVERLQQQESLPDGLTLTYCQLQVVALKLLREGQLRPPAGAAQ